MFHVQNFGNNEFVALLPNNHPAAISDYRQPPIP
jgi:hypothetical protein